ncbi:hypothetical protein P4S72_13065 [Vibrio sp. PP-XX7]
MPIQVDVLVAEERLLVKIWRMTPYLGWIAFFLLEDIRMIPVPGNHYRLVKAPAVAHVGRALSEAIHSRIPNAPLSVPRSPASTMTWCGIYGKEIPGGPTLLCIPGVGGAMPSFMELTWLMPPDWGVLGLQPRGLCGKRRALRTPVSILRCLLSSSP